MFIRGPHDPEMPLACLNETSRQLVGGALAPVPMKQGHPERIDDEYECNGTANVLFARLGGGGAPRSQTIVKPPITLMSSKTYRTSASLAPGTISTGTPRPRFTKPLRQPSAGGLWSASNGITRESMAREDRRRVIRLCKSVANNQT